MATADVQTVAPLKPAPASPGNRADLSMNKWQRKIGFIAGPFVLVALWVAPLPLPLEAHRLAAIMAFVIM
jgi:hypothetical protein